MAHQATVIEHPNTPRSRIIQAIRKCPALAAVAVHLPPIGHPQRRQCEEILANLLTYSHHSPEVSLRQARSWTDSADPAEVVETEITALRDDPDSSSLYLLWRQEIWLCQNDPWLQDQALLYVGLFWRICRREIELKAGEIGRQAESSAAVQRSAVQG